MATLSKVEKKYLKLLREYSEIKDELLDHTEEHHDAMLYDISGYNEESCADNEAEYLEDLEKQVKAARKLLEAHKELNYTFG